MSYKTLKGWDLGSGSERRALTGHSGKVSGVPVTRDGQCVISACKDNTVKIWELETGEVLPTFTCEGPATCCEFSDALELIVVGDAGGHVYLLHLEEPKPRN